MAVAISERDHCAAVSERGKIYIYIYRTAPYALHRFPCFASPSVLISLVPLQGSCDLLFGRLLPTMPSVKNP